MLAANLAAGEGEEEKVWEKLTGEGREGRFSMK